MATMSKPQPLIGGDGGTRAVAEKARDAATDVASTAKNIAREQVTERVNETKQRAVSGLGSVAGALRQTGDSADNDLLQDYVARAADGIEEVTDYFRTRNVGEIVGDVERFARREPALFIGGAFALGLLGARFLKSSTRPARVLARGLELEEDEFIQPRYIAPQPRPAMAPPEPLRGVQQTVGVEQQAPRPDNIDPYPQQHIGVLDPNKPNKPGGEGRGSL